MTFDKYPGTFISGVVGLALLCAGLIHWFVPDKNYIYKNTLADEPKIMEMTFARAMAATNPTYAAEIRQDVIKEFYSETIPNLDRKTPIILFSLSGFCLIFTVIGFFQYFWEETELSAFFRAKRKYWESKTEEEKKMVSELLRLQRKISGE